MSSDGDDDLAHGLAGIVETLVLAHAKLFHLFLQFAEFVDATKLATALV